MNEIIDKLVNLFIKYDDVINSLADNIYHNTDEDDIEIIKINIRLKYWNLLLANKRTLYDIESDLWLPDKRDDWYPDYLIRKLGL